MEEALTLSKNNVSHHIYTSSIITHSLHTHTHKHENFTQTRGQHTTHTLLTSHTLLWEMQKKSQNNNFKREKMKIRERLTHKIGEKLTYKETHRGK